MSKMIDLKDNPERQTISVNILKSQIKFLRKVKKERNLSISRIVEQSLANSFPESSKD